jgi:hypothetical protein
VIPHGRSRLRDEGKVERLICVCICVWKLNRQFEIFQLCPQGTRLDMCQALSSISVLRKSAGVEARHLIAEWVVKPLPNLIATASTGLWPPSTVLATPFGMLDAWGLGRTENGYHSSFSENTLRAHCALRSRELCEQLVTFSGSGMSASSNAVSPPRLERYTLRVSYNLEWRLFTKL